MAQSTITKPKPPPLEDWRDQVENLIKQGEHEKQDVLNIIWLGQELISEMGPASRWISEQSQYLNAIVAEYMRIYSTRFGEQPPPQPHKEASPEILLDTPERRKQTVREVALAIAKPGDNISDEAIVEELKRRGMKLDARNPTATISTILHGFKQFNKVDKTRGVFKRLE
jgi:hypothetical protein